MLASSLWRIAPGPNIMCPFTSTSQSGLFMVNEKFDSCCELTILQCDTSYFNYLKKALQSFHSHLNHHLMLLNLTLVFNDLILTEFTFLMFR